MFRRVYRITNSGYKIAKYKIEQRHTILFFLHWWSTPEFAPPHLFEEREDAYMHIREEDPNALIEITF